MEELSEGEGEQAQPSAGGAAEKEGIIRYQWGQLND